MEMRAAELAAIRLERARRFLLHASLIAIASLAVTVVVSMHVPNAFVPLSVLTAGEGLVVMCAYYVHRDLIQRLALEPIAEDIPPVRRYRERLLRQSERDRLAACIISLIADAQLPGAFPLGDRVAQFEGELRMLAKQLATPGISVQARSMVICVRLLSRGTESPLFNPRLSSEHLRSTLLRIRFGIGGHAHQ